MPDTVGFNSHNGHKYRFGNPVDYNQRCVEGDTITMIINMHKNKEFVKFKRNGNDIGIAFQGLGDWGD